MLHLLRKHQKKQKKYVKTSNIIVIHKNGFKDQKPFWIMNITKIYKKVFRIC